MNRPKKKYSQLSSMATPITRITAQVPRGGASSMRLCSSSVSSSFSSLSGRYRGLAKVRPSTWPPAALCSLFCRLLWLATAVAGAALGLRLGGRRPPLAPGIYTWSRVFQSPVVQNKSLVINENNLDQLGGRSSRAKCWTQQGHFQDARKITRRAGDMDVAGSGSAVGNDLTTARVAAPVAAVPADPASSFRQGAETQLVPGRRVGDERPTE